MVGLRDFLMDKPPLYVAGGAAYPYSSDLVARYRFKARFRDDLVNLHHIDADNGHILLPRALCPAPKGDADHRSKGRPVAFPKMPQPRDYQEDVFAELDAFIAQGQSGVVTAYTGFGKTVLGYRAAAVAGLQTLVVTTKDDIFEQWVADAPKFLGVHPGRVGRIRGDICEVVDADICVAMVHSLAKDKYPAWVWESFGLVIFDEVHRLPADEFSKSVWKLPAAIRLGLSADETRPDGKELLIQAHIGPVRARAEQLANPPKVLVYKSEWTCPKVYREDDETGQRILVPLPHAPGRTAKIEEHIAKNAKRNLKLASIIKEIHATPRRLVVFSTRTDHLENIKAACLELDIPASDIAVYRHASSKPQEAENERARTVKVVLTTYKMMGEGTNWPWLDTGLAAMPLARVKQPVGRITRLPEGLGLNKRPPVWIDVQDLDSPVFKGYANARMRWYGQIQAPIVNMV